MLTLEGQIAVAAADDLATNVWLEFYFRGRAFDVPDRDVQLAGFLRGYVLRCCAAALAHGFDGSEVSKPSRNANEHRVGEVAVGSRVLKILGDVGVPLCAIDWHQVLLRLEPQINGDRRDVVRAVAA
jgi:hypothetical protein